MLCYTMLCYAILYSTILSLSRTDPEDDDPVLRRDEGQDLAWNVTNEIGQQSIVKHVVKQYRIAYFPPSGTSSRTNQ